MKKIVLNLWCLNLELSITLSIKHLIKIAWLKIKLKKTLFEILENVDSYTDVSNFDSYIFQSFKTEQCQLRVCLVADLQITVFSLTN